MREVFTLLIEVGRRDGDGLPDGCAGAALLCYAPAHDEAEAVREAVSVLKVAKMAPLDVTGYGTAAEREADGQDIGDEERALMARALQDDAVVVAEVHTFDG